MDRKIELAHFAIAEKAVADGEHHIEREEQMLADLDRAGHDTKQARETLAIFQRMQAEHVAHRNLLLKLLQQQGGSPDPIYRPGHYEGSSTPREPDGDSKS